MVTVTYPSSIAINLMTSVLGGLAGAAISIRNQFGNGMIVGASNAFLSSSPGFMLPDGSVVVFGSSVGYSASGNTGILSSVSLGDTIVPALSGPTAMVAASSNGDVYFLGAIIPPPVGGVSDNGL